MKVYQLKINGHKIVDKELDNILGFVKTEIEENENDVYGFEIRSIDMSELEYKNLPEFES